jgi:hypothetical protein
MDPMGEGNHGVSPQGRLRRILRLARARGGRTLILGAWGCGVFRNTPEARCLRFRGYYTSRAPPKNRSAGLHTHTYNIYIYLYIHTCIHIYMYIFVAYNILQLSMTIFGPWHTYMIRSHVFLMNKCAAAWAYTLNTLLYNLGASSAPVNLIITVALYVWFRLDFGQLDRSIDS